MRRYIYIIIGIVVLALVAIGVLLFIKGSSGNAPTTTTGTLPTTGTTGVNGSSGNSVGTITLNSPSSPNGVGQSSTVRFGVLSNQPVLDYFVTAQNEVIAIQPNGSVFSIINGQSTILSTTTIGNIVSASFSYDGKYALVTSGSASNPQAALFNTATQSWSALPQGMLSPQWAPKGYQIAYLTGSGGTLSISEINATNLKAGVGTIFTLHANDMTLQWPAANQFILSDKSSAAQQGSIWSFNTQTRALTPIIYEAAGAESTWSHTTSTIGLIFSVSQTGSAQPLYMEDFYGNKDTLNFSTLPSKCTLSADASAAPSYVSLYCGVPRSSSGFSSANLPDAYNMRTLFTPDDIYKVNAASGALQILWSDQSQNIDASDLKVFNNTLFFINRYNQELYGLIFS